MKATPIRELKRRKLDDMVGMEKLGRATYALERRSLTRAADDEDTSLASGDEESERSSVGRTCERRLFPCQRICYYVRSSTETAIHD